MGSLIYPKFEKVKTKAKCEECEKRAEYCIIYAGGDSEYYCLRHFYRKYHEIFAISIFQLACERAKEDLFKK